MPLSIKKISAINEDQQAEKVQTKNKVYFRAKTENTLTEDTFEKKNKKKKVTKIVAWLLAVLAAVAAVVLFKKGKAIENAGKKADEVIEDVVDDAQSLGRRVKDEVEDLAGNSRKTEERVQNTEVSSTVQPETAVTEPEKSVSAVPEKGTETSVTEPEKSVSAVPEKGTETSVTEPEKSVTPIKIKEEPRVFTETEVRDAVNARLDRTVPIIPEELKTIKIEHPEFKTNIKEITGMDLKEIESIPLSKYDEVGNGIIYEEELSNGRKIRIQRFDENLNNIGLMFISGKPDANGERLLEYGINFRKSEIVFSDRVKGLSYHYETDGHVNNILINRGTLGTYTYDAQGKLFRILEPENQRMMTQRRIYFDTQTGNIKKIQYFDTTRQGWEGMKADYFDKNGEFSREIFSDDALRIARKKEEIKEKIKFDRTIPEISEELRTIKIKHQNVKQHLDEIGINMEEIKRIPTDKYKKSPGGDLRFEKQLPNGKKLIVIRYKSDNFRLRIFTKGPQGSEYRIICDYSAEPSWVLDIDKQIEYLYDNGKLYQINTLLNDCSYNAEGKLQEILIKNPETNIIHDIKLDVQTGKIASITYKENSANYLEYDVFNSDGEIIAEYFPENL